MMLHAARLGAPDRLDLLDQVVEVEVLKPSLTQCRHLKIEPSGEIFLIERNCILSTRLVCHGHDLSGIESLTPCTLAGSQSESRI